MKNNTNVKMHPAMPTKLKIAGIIVSAAFVMTAAAQVTQPAASTAPADSQTEKMIQEMKKPFPWFNWGATFGCATSK